MMHMLSCLDLKQGESIEDFSISLDEFASLMRETGLVHSVGPIGRRLKHPVMDTDTERDLEYYFIMSFKDRSQCDRAVEYIYAHNQPGEHVHELMYSKVADPVFICWEDIEN